MDSGSLQTFASGFCQRRVCEAHPCRREGQCFVCSVHSAVAERSGDFHLLAIVMRAAGSHICVCICLSYLFSVPLGIYLGAELLGHIVILHLTFH